MEADTRRVLPAERGSIELPMVTAKRPRLTASRRLIPADNRNANEYTVQLQSGGKRRATCLECHAQFAEGEVRMCKSADLRTGGRWCHVHCLPGGLRIDDTLVATGEETLEMTALIRLQQSRNRQDMAVDASESTATQGVQVIQNALQTISIGSSLDEPSGESPKFDLQEAADDDVAESAWLEALKSSAVVISDLTPNFHGSYREVKAALIRDALSLDDESVAGRQAWRRLLLVDKLLFHKGGEAGESLNSKLRSRFQAIKDGEWLLMLAELLEGNMKPVDSKRGQSDKKLADRILSLAKQESWRKAISALKSTAAPDRSLAAWDKLQKELPNTDARCSRSNGHIELNEQEQSDLRDRIRSRIRQADGAASSGLLGSAANMWKVLVRDDNDEVTELVIDLFERVAVGKISQDTRDMLMHSDLLAVPRPDGECVP